MRSLALVLLSAGALALPDIAAAANWSPLMAISSSTDAPVMHGGGCRKSSPPGQCCHMEKRVGRVHCH